MSKALTSITVGAVVGGLLGFLIGLVTMDNPFTAMAVGIAVGAGASSAVGAARNSRSPRSRRDT